MCPKVLMFDGLDVLTELDEAKAKYWGQVVGVDGFFINHVMAGWTDSVGDDEGGETYRRVRKFHDLYSKFGVSDDFIKVAVYKQHDWRDPDGQSRVVSNFRQAAHLARYAGLKGLALDLEDYVGGHWANDPTDPDKADRVYSLGRRIGGAILSEFPDGEIIVLPEVLAFTCPPYSEKVCQNYDLVRRFWDGLVQAHFRELFIAAEQSYDLSQPNLIAGKMREIYHSNLVSNGIDPADVGVLLGIWPLGKTYTDKSAWCTPAQFEERLRLAFRERAAYVWIYGHGSAWEKEGPYGNGDVDPRFDEFVQALHRVKRNCLEAR